MGPTLLGFFLWACPRAVSWPLGVVYGLHVLFGNAMHTGTFVRVLVDFGQRRCARSFLARPHGIVSVFVCAHDGRFRSYSSLLCNCSWQMCQAILMQFFGK